VRNPRTIAIALGLVFLLIAGFLFLRSPKPLIELKAETIFSLGPLDVTNTMVTSWLVIIFLAGFTYAATRRMRLIPSGLQNFLEVVIEWIYNLVVSTAGEKHGRRFFPVVATILIYVVVANWFGLLPFFATVGKVEEVTAEEYHDKAIVVRDVGGLNVIMPNAGDFKFKAEDNAPLAEKEAAIREATQGKLSEDEEPGLLIPFLRSVNTDLNAPLALAIMSAIFVEFWGISTHGFFRYASRFFNFGRLLRGKILDGIIDIFVGLLEFIAELARLVSFTFRLFGNIFAGEMLFLVVIFLLPLVALQFVYFLELFVGLIQAFIFAMLTLVFGVIAVTAHGGEGEEHT
jgi:F-type H+-transporting ATPase subunit a